VREASLRVSCDQLLRRHVGPFLRAGLQSDMAAVDHGMLVSGGLDLSGDLWGRERDDLGVGYAYLASGNAALHRSQVLELSGCGRWWSSPRGRPCDEFVTIELPGRFAPAIGASPMAAKSFRSLDFVLAGPAVVARL